MWKMDGQKMLSSLGTLMYGLLRVFGGLFLIWRNLKDQKPGTWCGLDWPYNLEAILSDVRVLFLLIGAVLLIYVGIFGEEMSEKSPTAAK